MGSDVIDKDVDAAIAGARSGALSFPANLVGAEYRVVRDGRCSIALSPRRHTRAADGTVATSVFYTLFDLALSGAARSRTGRTAAVPTVSLQVEHRRRPSADQEIVCHASFVRRLGDLLVVEGRIEDEGSEPLAYATGRYLVQPNPSRPLKSFPWEADSLPAEVGLQVTLDADERSIRDFFRHAEREAEAMSWEALHRITVDSRDAEGCTVLRQPVGPHLANRSGSVHGGAMAGLLAQTCRVAVEADGTATWQMVWSSITYLRRGRLEGGDMLATASRAFGGRRLAVLAADLRDESGTTLARGEACFVDESVAG